MRMRAREKLRVEQVGKPNARGVFGFAREARNRDLRHRRHRLSNHIQILRRIALPLFRDDLFVAFDERIAGQMAAAGREIAHHRQLYLNERLRLWFEFYLILPHRDLSSWDSLICLLDSSTIL